MKHHLWTCGCLLLFGFAPAPLPRDEPDPDKQIQRFEKDVEGKEADAVEARKKKLIASLKKLQEELEKKGKTDKVDAVRERLLLLDAVSAEHLLGKTAPAELFKGAGVNKYRRLTRVLLVPSDQANYNQFADFGFWNSNSYAGVNDLEPGYWVYIYPRWYIWREHTAP